MVQSFFIHLVVHSYPQPGYKSTMGHAVESLAVVKVNSICCCPSAIAPAVASQVAVRMGQQNAPLVNGRWLVAPHHLLFHVPGTASVAAYTVILLGTEVRLSSLQFHRSFSPFWRWLHHLPSSTQKGFPDLCDLSRTPVASVTLGSCIHNCSGIHFLTFSFFFFPSDLWQVELGEVGYINIHSALNPC